MSSNASRSSLTLVAAMAKNWVVGKDNQIPWKLPEDMKHFVKVTKGHAVIMGRLTWLSIGKPLPKRRNIVITRTPELENSVPPGVEVCGSLQAALALAATTDPEPCVIGGGQIYREALPLATKMHLTVLHEDHEGDTFFPQWNDDEWKIEDVVTTEAAEYYTLVRV